MAVQMEKYDKALEIVEENFFGLSDFIDDEDILEFYKSLIAECMVDFCNNKN